MPAARRRGCRGMRRAAEQGRAGRRTEEQEMPVNGSWELLAARVVGRTGVAADMADGEREGRGAAILPVRADIQPVFFLAISPGTA